MRISVVILLLVALTSCSSVKDDRQRFKSKHDFNIGRNINVNGDTPLKIVSTNDPAVKNYIYKNSATGCEWMLVVELQTIKSWKYLSAPDLCVLKVNWGGS